MKKSKFAIVIALGLVLCLLCGVTTTFSWFSRPREESGDSLGWSGQYKISNGKNISIKTVESSDDGSTFAENPVTDFGGPLQAGERRYFCTEISNSGNTEQNVSLFIKNLKTCSSTSGTLSAPVRRTTAPSAPSTVHTRCRTASCSPTPTARWTKSRWRRRCT